MHNSVSEVFYASGGYVYIKQCNFTFEPSKTPQRSFKRFLTSFGMTNRGCFDV